ncbi:hypothetical protein AYO44_06780 [Planctomycetaceae bacterium SCGC AG-212-F19]|nr:hypothetical protein AYO44_06780 [Planctomycetaceae bacterium SCGC AG-212-F19]
MKVAAEMDAAPSSILFPERYKEHVACALDMVGKHMFLDPPAAIASVYLATRFEFFFRTLSGKLKSNGEWVDAAAKAAATASISDDRLNRKKLSDVALTYKVMKLDQSRPAAQVLNTLDKALFKVPITATGGFKVADIGDRIAFGRHNTGHGEWGDISSEAVFYGLVTAIIFYNQN